MRVARQNRNKLIGKTNFLTVASDALLLRFVSASLCILLTGCFPLAPERNRALEEARSAYSLAVNDAELLRYARDSVIAAREEIAAAERVAAEEPFFRDESAPATIDHHSYLARQHLRIARETVDWKRAGEALDRASLQRKNLVLTERTRAAEAEAERAELARKQAEAKADEAELEQQRLTYEERMARARRLDALDRARELEAASKREQAGVRKPADQQERFPKSAALAGLNARETQRGLALTLGDDSFDYLDGKLIDSATPALDRIGAFLRENPKSTILLEGHTDDTGSEEYNLYLTEQKLNAARAGLTSRGIAEDRISVKAYGETRPIASNDTAAGRQQNRRVEIVISNAGAAGREGAQQRK